MGIAGENRSVPGFAHIVGQGMAGGAFAGLLFALLMLVPVLNELYPAELGGWFVDGWGGLLGTITAGFAIAAIVGLVGGGVLGTVIWLYFRFLPLALVRYRFLGGFLCGLALTLPIALYNGVYQFGGRGTPYGDIMFATNLFLLLMVPVLYVALVGGWFARRYFGSPHADDA